MSSNTLPSRAAQTPLHKMYTFVYRTFIKFILFCRGQALDVCRGLARRALDAVLELLNSGPRKRPHPPKSHQYQTIHIPHGSKHRNLTDI